MIGAFRSCDKPNMQEVQSGKEIQISIQQEKEKEFAEFVNIFQGDKAMLKEMRKFYDKQVEKWEKRLLDSHKKIEENHKFYQEGRKIWMNDLAVLSRALRNLKGSFESILRDVLTQAVSVERKLSEILTEVTPFAGYSNDHQKNELRELSSSLLLTKINGELKEKIREMAKFHEKIDSILDNSEWTKTIETETSKTIERVNKYLGIYSDTEDLNRTLENLEDLKSQIQPHLLREMRNAAKNTTKSITPIRVRVSSKKVTDEKKVAEFIGNERQENQLQNIINANQSYDMLNHSNSSQIRKKPTQQIFGARVELESDKNPQGKAVVHENPKFVTPASKMNLPFQGSERNAANFPESSAKSNKDHNHHHPSQNMSYQSLSMANRVPMSEELNLQSEKNVLAFKKRIEDVQLSPIARLDFGPDTPRMGDSSENSTNPGAEGNLQKDEPIKCKPRTLKSFICGCK